MTNIKGILFDLGGVLVRLNGWPINPSWLAQPMEDQCFWPQWLAMPCLDAYHRGQISSQDFAKQVIANWQLNCSPEDLLSWFTAWPDSLLPDALQLVQQVRPGVHKAIFSNINEAHWPLVQAFGLLPLFDQAFGSHLCQLAKPDPAFYLYACAQMKLPPSQVLLLDDTLINIETAIGLGMHAKQVQGTQEARAALLEHGLLDS